MNPQRKKILLRAGGIVALLIVAAILVLSLFDITSHKAKIETVASEATGLDIRIAGKMGLSFFPFGFSAEDVRVAGKGGQILTLDRLGIGVELLPLLGGRIKIAGCEIVKPSLTVVKNTDGSYNFAPVSKKPREESPGRAFGLRELKLSRGKLLYLDKKTDERTELNGIELTLRDLSLADVSGDIIRNLSFGGSIGCRELMNEDLKIEHIKSSVTAHRGVFVLAPLTMEIFGAKGEGSVTVDRAKVDAEYRINLKVPKLDFEKLTESFGAGRMIGGKGDLMVSLAVKGKEGRTLLAGMEGTLSLRGDNLTAFTMDLDRVLSAYETSRQFNLTDIGAYFIAGPLGAVALKTYRFGDLYSQTQGGSGTITRFISHWKIGNGTAEALDCALATRSNRIALKGKLDFVGKRYQGITVALLDARGCAQFVQRISGAFGSPQLGAVSAVTSLVGPLADIYRQARRLLQGGACEVFYDGAVPHPR
ncbi:MAG: AsmA family protein [Syntrophales bacterium]